MYYTTLKKTSQTKKQEKIFLFFYFIGQDLPFLRESG